MPTTDAESELHHLDYSPSKLNLRTFHLAGVQDVHAMGQTKGGQKYKVDGGGGCPRSVGRSQFEPGPTIETKMP